eukprot:Amastigsp_a764_217.p3 type:complete len:122 gc:universal Amastigsp_a764_217:482-117(-)
MRSGCSTTPVVQWAPCGSFTRASASTSSSSAPRSAPRATPGATSSTRPTTSPSSAVSSGPSTQTRWSARFSVQASSTCFAPGRQRPTACRPIAMRSSTRAARSRPCSRSALRTRSRRPSTL